MIRIASLRRAPLRLVPLLVLAVAAAYPRAASAEADEAKRNKVFYNRSQIAKDAVQGWSEQDKTCVRRRVVQIQNDPKQGKVSYAKLKTVLAACH